MKIDTLEKDINDPNDVTRIITSPAFKQMLGDQSVKLGYSARDRAINSVIKQAENFKKFGISSKTIIESLLADE